MRYLRNTYDSVADGIGRPDHFQHPITPGSVENAIHSQHPSVIAIKSHVTNNYTFSFKNTNVVDVKKNMKNIDIRKSTGYDNISSYFIKTAAEELCIPVSVMINYCIEQNHYPDAHKRAETSPLFKAKDMYSKENYRPVSCLTTISKLIEYEMNSQMVNHAKTFFSDKLSASEKVLVVNK